MPSSSLVKVEVDVGVEVGVGVEVKVGVEVEVGVRGVGDGWTYFFGRVGGVGWWLEI